MAVTITVKNLHIKHLVRKEIDEAAWDNCIDQATNGLIYARCILLDKMADNWDALVLGNYEMVMPLPWRKKWGIRYVYQVPFIQRLGVYGNDKNEDTEALFYEVASKHFRFINYKTAFIFSEKLKRIRACTNYILPLRHSYKILQENYTKECKKNISKATSRGCILKEVSDPNLPVHFFKNTYGNFYKNYKPNVYEQMVQLIKQGLHEGFCRVFTVNDAHNETVFAAGIFIDNKRIYYTIAAPNAKGRAMRATYFFINEIIKQYAGQNLMFDFEGSDIPDVAAFYQKFNPLTEQYSDVLINRLPAPIRWIKKK